VGVEHAREADLPVLQLVEQAIDRGLVVVECPSGGKRVFLSHVDLHGL
jgi:hypothetical protein